MSRTRFGLLSLTCFAFLALSCPAQTVYNPTTDFSATSNPTPTGFWSYGYASSPTSAFNLFTSSGIWNGKTGLNEWNRGASNPYPDYYPLVFKNTTDAAIVYDSSFTGVAGQFGLVGGPYGLVAVARLTLPAPGDYMLSATFTRLETVTSNVDT